MDPNPVVKIVLVAFWFTLTYQQYGVRTKKPMVFGAGVSSESLINAEDFQHETGKCIRTNPELCETYETFSYSWAAEAREVLRILNPILSAVLTSTEEKIRGLLVLIIGKIILLEVCWC